MRRSRGNVLMTAIFICVFLFFLSVALVTVNRQDLLLALTTDARYRSRMAARAGAEYALQLMRERPHWQQLIGQGNVYQGELAGSEWSVSVEPFADEERSGYFWDVHGQGRASGILESHHMIVEEVALVRDLPEGTGAFLFASSTGGDLLMLDGSLKWRKLGTVPSLEAWLQARNGPLFTHSEMGHVLTLAMDGDTFEWQIIPEPGIELLRVKPVGKLTEWYELTGRALGADGDRVYSHAKHVLDQRDDKGKGEKYEAPAVLSYDLSEQQWRVVSDNMTVTNPVARPQIREGPKPFVDTMGIVDGRVYALQLGDLRQVILAGDDSWSEHMNIQGVTRGLFEIGGRLAVHEAGGELPAGSTDFGVGGLWPQAELGLVVPEVGRVYDVQGEPTRIRPELRWDVTVSSRVGKPIYGADSIAVVGTTVITPLLVRRTAMEPGLTPCLPPFDVATAFTPLQALVLGVHDGQHWQVLPGGMQFCVSVEVPRGSADAIRIQAEDGNVYTLGPERLAAALYPDPDAAMRRYAVVARY